MDDELDLEQEHDIYKFSSSDLQIQETHPSGREELTASSGLKKGLYYCCHIYIKLIMESVNSFLGRKGTFNVFVYVSVAEDWCVTCVGNSQEQDWPRLSRGARSL